MSCEKESRLSKLTEKVVNEKNKITFRIKLTFTPWIKKNINIIFEIKTFDILLSLLFS